MKHTKKFHPSMLLHLVCVFAIGIPLALGYLGNRSAGDNRTANETAGDSVPNKIAEKSSLPPTSSVLSDEKDGVSITVEPENGSAEGSVFILDLNNHSYDLSTMDIGGLSHLNDVSASAYELVDSQIGGHHAKARITFPTSPAGELHIGLNEEISFYFNL